MNNPKPDTNMVKALKIACAVVIHIAAGLIATLGLVGDYQGINWAPVNENGQIVKGIEIINAEALSSLGLGVILFFWMYVALQRQGKNRIRTRS